MSSDAFSFDQATPAEAMEGTNDSADSSAIHSSPETGSFSQVTSTNRSESVKRQRPQIEDTEPESRPGGREEGSLSRQKRSTSAPKPGRTGAVRRTREKSKSSGGSPNDRRKMATADELEAKLREMEDQGTHMRTQIQRLEDENNAARIMYSSKMQSIKDECSEFDHQYNHVLGCWRQAEERSKTFEMELRSEIRLFQEAREHLGEMQRQFGHVMQEDYGASLRIQELEGLLNRERAQFQSNAALFTQETKQECAELRDRADRIRLEASEAAKDSQQFHES